MTRRAASDRLSEMNARSSRARKAQDADNAALIAALGNRDYHLPGNGYWQDYRQYFANNHPLFGICCHNRLSPVSFRQRIFVLVGSMAFGLAITNFIVLYFLQNPYQAVLQPFFKVSLNVTVEDQSESSISVSGGQMFLWVVGGALHSWFDLSIWHITACVCCQPGGQLECLSGCKVLGNYAVIFITVCIVAAASFIVVLRATIDSEGEGVVLTDLDSGGLVDDQIHLAQVDGIESYEFLLSWLIEVATALFVWYPITGSILFSGILGCGTLPFLGGRPRDVKVEEWENTKKMTRRCVSTDDDSYDGPA